MEKDFSLGKLRLWLPLALVVCLLMSAPHASMQTGPIPVTDTNHVGKGERVDLETGKYKYVFRNKAGQIVREDYWEESGSVMHIIRLYQRTTVQNVYPSGK